jgi:peptidoglycan/xylan/chitin deacetylase (PgdA/CDA1 family)
MKDVIFQVLYTFGVPKLLRLSKTNTVTVLSLHRVSEERDFFFDPIKPKNFEKMIEYCCKYYSIINFEQLDQKTTKPKLILSFDDGYYDFIENVLPILKKQGLPSNHNIVNRCASDNEIIWTQKLNDIFNHFKSKNITQHALIDPISRFEGNWIAYYMSLYKHLLVTNKKDRTDLINTLTLQYTIQSNYRMMNWSDVEYCAKNDVEIGSHTTTHNSLSTIFTVEEFESEIKNSIEEISQKINKKVNVLALPNGQISTQAMDYIKTLEIKHVLLVNDKVNKCNTSRNFHWINRINVSDSKFPRTVHKIELFDAFFKK